MVRSLCRAYAKRALTRHVVSIYEFPPVKWLLCAHLTLPRSCIAKTTHQWHVKTSETNTIEFCGYVSLCASICQRALTRRCIHLLEFPPSVKTVTVSAHLTLPRSCNTNHTPWHVKTFETNTIEFCGTYPLCEHMPKSADPTVAIHLLE
jgi:hypothetical protein